MLFNIGTFLGEHMKTRHRVLLGIAALALLAAAGCKPPLDLSMQRNRIFLLGRLLAGQTCDVRLVWRTAPGDSVPVSVTADLSAIGGDADEELVPDADNTAIWRWTGQVAPDEAGEQVVTVTAVDGQGLAQDIGKRFRVFDTDKAIGIATGGSDSCLALKADGSVVEWTFGEATNRATPVEATDIIAVASGGTHSLALKADGTVIAWGCDIPTYDAGQCAVPEGLGDVVAIAAGFGYSLALKADGTVVAWGGFMKFFGEFVNTYVPEGLDDVVAVAAGEGLPAAIQADGTLQPWTDNYTRVDDAVSVAIGEYYDLIVQSDGSVTIIDGGDISRLPLRVGRLKATAVDAGQYNSIALQADGSVIIWHHSPPGGYFFDAEVFHRFRLHSIIAVAALGNRWCFLVLSEDGSVIAWNELWSRPALNEQPVPQELE